MPTQAKIFFTLLAIVPFLMGVAVLIAVVVMAHSSPTPPPASRNEFHYISGYEVIV